MLPEAINGDACGIAGRWLLDSTLAEGLVLLERVAEERFTSAGTRWPGLWIISGQRSRADQARLNPLVKDSLHTRCPALAADLRVGSIPGLPSAELLQFAGGIWMALGFRWGGLFSDFPNPAHFDVGRT